MSAIAIYTKKNFAVIATDTLVYRIEEGRDVPVRFRSKTAHYPELKCCVTTLGYIRLADDLRAFINDKVMAFDIDGLINYIQLYFLDYLDATNYNQIEDERYDPVVLGDLRIIGYSDEMKCLKHFSVSVDRDNLKVNEHDMDVNGTLMHPKIKNEAVLDAIFKNNNLIDNLLVEVLKQMNKESLDDDLRTVGVGGSIMLTSISADPDFYMLVSTPHKFDSFPAEFAGIMKRRIEKLLAAG